MKIQQIKSQIKNISKEFNLKYNSKWFKFMYITIRHEILTEYIGTCPDPIYQKYGRKAEQRIKNIDKFVKSKDFKKCLKRYGGQVASKRGLDQEQKWFEKAKNKKLKVELLRLHKKIRKHIGKSNSIALITIPRNKKERDWLLKYCLIHEWIHIFLYANNIKFEKINKKYWKYDEGLCTYFTEILENNIEKLEYFRKKTKYPMEKQYYVYAIKFRELLKDKKTPKERKKAIVGLMRELR